MVVQPKIVRIVQVMQIYLRLLKEKYLHQLIIVILQQYYSVHRHHHHRQVSRPVRLVIQHRHHHHHQIELNRIDILIIHRHRLTTISVWI